MRTQHLQVFLQKFYASIAFAAVGYPFRREILRDNFPRAKLSARLGFADELGHGAHRTVDAPAAGLEQRHGGKTQHRRGQHNAVKAECELRYAGMEQRAVVGPVPRQFEGPEQRDRLSQTPYTGEHQKGVPQHEKEHGKEKDQKPVSKPLTLHPSRDVLFPGQPESPAQ